MVFKAEIETGTPENAPTSGAPTEGDHPMSTEMQKAPSGIKKLVAGYHSMKAKALKEREKTRFKQFKITPEDWRNREKWDGYQVAGSLGRRIMDGAQSVKIFGQELPVRCKVKNISGYSAHADQPRLLNWLKPMKASLKKVFVVQGEEEQMAPLANKIRDEMAIDAVIPSAGEEVML